MLDLPKIYMYVPKILAGYSEYIFYKMFSLIQLGCLKLLVQFLGIVLG